MTTLKVEELPRKVLETVALLRKQFKTVYMVLYSLGEPACATDVAKLVDCRRANVSMKLNFLVDMGLVKRKRKGRTVLFEVIK